jgi:hypothetical protein
MKDPVIVSKVDELKSLVEQVNTAMKDLQDLNVDVRISYVERNKAKDITQGISLWRAEEHNGYL